jgi:hypothetical protein
MRYDASSDRYVPCDWDTAFAMIGSYLRALESPQEGLTFNCKVPRGVEGKQFEHL